MKLKKKNISQNFVITQLENFERNPEKGKEETDHLIPKDYDSNSYS
jgi:hypothetical protein